MVPATDDEVGMRSKRAAFPDGCRAGALYSMTSSIDEQYGGRSSRSPYFAVCSAQKCCTVPPSAPPILISYGRREHMTRALVAFQRATPAAPIRRTISRFRRKECVAP